MIGCFLT